MRTYDFATIGFRTFPETQEFVTTFTRSPEFVVNLVPVLVRESLFLYLQKIRLIQRLEGHVLILDIENHPLNQCDN
jgi:hypothetical protein